MKLVKPFSIFLSVLLFVSACRSGDDTEYIAPASTGTQGRILVVMSKEKWNGPQGDIVREVLQSEILGMPQPEAMYGVTQIPLEVFSSITKREKNLFVVTISSEIEKSNLKVQYDLWAYPQIVVTVQAKNTEEFEKLMRNNADKIVNLYIEAERERLISAYKSLSDKKIIATLGEKYNLKLTIPQGYKLDVSHKNFAWLSLETPNSTQALLIWDYPYKDTSDLNLNNLVFMRDSITMHNVPGPREGSFMMTEKNAAPIHFHEMLLGTRYVAELRGLWKTEGAFMGGPFVSHSSVDTLRNRIVTVDGFVYGGKNNKRNLMRQVEAIMHTLEFTPASSP